MIFALFTLFVALTISGIAAYYSIAGLCAIFAAAVTPVIIMGAALEAGKITATVWLHKYWKRAGWQFKLYLIPAIVILMLVTSMGIFGFLSKAHMDQTVTVGDSSAKVSILDEKIATEKGNIESAKKALQQMDAQVDQMLSRTTDDKGTNRAVQIRKQQATERKNLQKEITTAQQNIAQLQNERAPLAAATRKIEAEVGPIKYIAALIYGDNPDANLLERAVRWVIILLVLVFDPLALVLILAAEQTIEWARADRKIKKAEADAREGWHQEWVPDTENPWHDIPPLTEEEVTKIRQEADVNDAVETEKFFNDGKELAKAIDDNNGHLPDEVVDKHAYLKQPWSWFKNEAGPVVYTPPSEPVVITRMLAPESNPDVIVEPVLVNEVAHKDPDPINPVHKPIEDIPHDPAPFNPSFNQVVIPDLSITAEDTAPVNANFGTEFPVNPQKGDMYLRVDYLPSRLYKWNEKKWIEVDKEHSDQYAYDQEYIKHLIEKIDRGEYDVDLLSEVEQEQIQRYLNEQSRT